MTKSRTLSSAARIQRALIEVDFLLAAVHYAEEFDGGSLSIEEANPAALRGAIKFGFVEVQNDAEGEPREVALTKGGLARVVAMLNEAEVPTDDHEAIAEWAQSVSPRVKQFEATISSWSKLELHALESMINEVRR